jgi:hypothetical protein
MKSAGCPPPRVRRTPHEGQRHHSPAQVQLLPESNDVIFLVGRESVTPSRNTTLEAESINLNLPAYSLTGIFRTSMGPSNADEA